jgi:hypothetical protein
MFRAMPHTREHIACPTNDKAEDSHHPRHRVVRNLYTMEKFFRSELPTIVIAKRCQNLNANIWRCSLEMYSIAMTRDEILVTYRTPP